jgi:hypothetical protein
VREQRSHERSFQQASEALHRYRARAEARAAGSAAKAPRGVPVDLTAPPPGTVVPGAVPVAPARRLAFSLIFTRGRNRT